MVYHLSQLGKEQARTLADKIREFFGTSLPKAKLVTSTAPRATEYAHILAQLLSLHAQSDVVLGSASGFVDKVEIVYPLLHKCLTHPFLILVSHETFTSDVMEYLGADPDHLKNKPKTQWRSIFYTLNPGQAYAFNRMDGSTILLP